MNTPANETYKELHPPKTKDDDFHYADEYVGNKVFDAIIAVYLIALGEFDLDGYKMGPNIHFVWLMFVACTFIILIVFMNMLIAIMGDTFG